MKPRAIRRKSGTFRALILDRDGRIVWKCDHEHRHGTSNRSDHDSASKCAWAEIKRMKEQAS